MTWTPDDLKASGRTTRMLQIAIGEARKAQRIAIMAVDPKHAKRLYRMLCNLADEEDGLCQEDPYMLCIRTPEKGYVRVFVHNGEADLFKGIHRPTKWPIMIDHYTIERLYGPLIKEYHRYDPEPQPQPKPEKENRWKLPRPS